MTTKTFVNKLKILLNDSGDFDVDTINMEDSRELARKNGFDDVILVVGEDDQTIFTLTIQKINFNIKK